MLARDTLDQILSLQLTVAWAGEGICEPPRLGWWKTDLIDLAGGGDLLARLLPKTAAWASLEAVREAATRVEGRTRLKMADPDRLRTLFFLGFDLDEQLAERLAELKRSPVPPDKALILPDLAGDLDRERLAALLQPAAIRGDFSVAPRGRKMKGAMPDAPLLAVQQLAAALLPLGNEYSMPFYRIR